MLKIRLNYENKINKKKKSCFCNWWREKNINFRFMSHLIINKSRQGR